MRTSLLLLALPTLLLAKPDKSLEALIERVSKGSDNPVKRSDTDAPPRAHKRWVWGGTIINDDTPTAGLPAPGVNVNLLSSGAFSVETPAVTLVAPSFAPLPSALVAAAAAPSVSTSTKKKHRAHKSSATAAPVSASAPATPAKRWVLGNSIIQDDSPTSGLPAPGVNANLLSSGASVATPQVTLVAPTFAPVAPAVATHAVAGLSSAHHRSPAPHHSLAKKWIRGASIIQDGDSAPAPAVATTPEVTLVAPTFSSSVVPVASSSLAAANVSTPAAKNASAPAPLNSAAVISALAAENRAALFKLYQKEKHLPVRERSTEMDMDMSKSMQKVKRVQE